MNCRDTTRRLGAYLDGELSSVASERVRRHLDGCPTCLRHFDQQLGLAAAIRADLPYHQAPAALRTRVRCAVRAASAPAAPPARQFRLMALAASLLLAVAAGWTLGTQRGGLPSGSDLAGQVLTGHIRSLMVDHLNDVESSDHHTVKPWFDGKLDYSPPVPDLSPEGFTLLGGRLDYIGGRPVAAIAYARRRHVINLYVWPGGESEARVSSTSRQGYTLLHWKRGGMTYWAASDLNPTELHQFVLLLQRAETAPVP
jgi:mycothiol system anti-sigma-R factor